MMYKNPLEGWQELDQVYIPPRTTEGFTANVLHRDIWVRQPKKESLAEEPVVLQDLNEDQTVLLQEEPPGEEEDKTVLLVAEEPEAAEKNPYIIRMVTNERIDVNSQCFVIGKSQDADYQINGNEAISRRHVQITKTDGTYYAEDLGSSNHTYIEDKAIEEPTELKHEQVFKIADEEFCFYLV